MKTDVTVKNQEIKKIAIHKLAVLVKQLIGDRSIRGTAEDTGVTASYITGILKERYLPSANILKRLASAETNPQNGITLEDLMIAAGYQESYAEPTVFKLQDKTEKHELLKFRALASGIIYTTLVDKRILFSNTKDIAAVRGFKPDMSMDVSINPISEWWFKYSLLTTEDLFSIKQVLAQFFFIPQCANRKISLVISNKKVFHILCGYKNELAYRGDLSLILIDEKHFTITKEEYLTHYDPEKTDSEFYIV